MRYFVLFEDDGDSLIKKIAGYHQFHGVREAVRVTTIASADSDDGEVRERRASYVPAASALPLTKTQTPEQANSREELREMLASRESGGIIFTTVQKFSLLDDEDEHPLLCQRSNVVVISDEAHRSQYGLKARLKQIKDKETGEVTGAKYVFGYAKHMRAFRKLAETGLEPV